MDFLLGVGLGKSCIWHRPVKVEALLHLQHTSIGVETASVESSKGLELLSHQVGLEANVLAGAILIISHSIGEGDGSTNVMFLCIPVNRTVFDGLCALILLELNKQLVLLRGLLLNNRCRERLVELLL
jgi:hypothetical protein